jgi:hypothetical protein
MYNNPDSKIIYQTDDWCLKLEYNKTLNIFLVHHYIYNWSHSLLKKALHDWEVIRSVLNALGVNEFYTPGMNAKYAHLFGFKETGSKIIYNNGNVEDLLKWEME